MTHFLQLLFCIVYAAFFSIILFLRIDKLLSAFNFFLRMEDSSWAVATQMYKV